MKNVVEIADRALRTTKKAEVQSAKPAQVVSMRVAQAAIGEWFGKAFEQILAACPRYQYSLPNQGMVEAAVTVWMRALVGAGITDKRTVDNGIKALAETGNGYLPSVGEFIRLCRKESVGGGVPSAMAVKAEIIRGEKPWSCRLVEYLAGQCGSILHSSTDPKAGHEAFLFEYDKAVALAKSGGFENERSQAECLPQKKDDPNLAHYRYLLSAWPDQATGFLEECRGKGIIINPDAGTVVKAGGVNLKQEAMV